MNDIQYPAALDENGHLVKACSLRRETLIQRVYRCPYCNEEMVPVLGEIREKHFRHLGTQCTKDQYLHGYAERRFMEEYQYCLDNHIPFFLQLSVPAWCNESCVLFNDQCKERLVRQDFELTQLLNKVSQEERVETQDGNIRVPDILLQTEDGKHSIWIEFCVTHRVDERKRTEGRIVEIKVDSVKEIDTMMKSHRISQSDDPKNWVRIYNFDTSHPVDAPLEGVPLCEEYYIFDVQKDSISKYGRVEEIVPPRHSDIKYRIVLRLNWLGGHDIENDLHKWFPRKSQKDLYSWCQKRYGQVDIEDESSISSLIVSEYRNPNPPPEPITRTTRVIQHPLRSKLLLSGKRKYISTAIEGRNHSFNSLNTEPGAAIQDLPKHDESTLEWIDLGLPSGTLWADKDSRNGRLEGPISLPSRAQCIELRDHCRVEFVDGKLKLSGPSGASITFDSGIFRLSDRGRDGVRIMSLYSSVGGVFHFFEDDYSSKHRFRYTKKG